MNPAAARFRAMCEPMIPVPMSATRLKLNSFSLDATAAAQAVLTEAFLTPASVLNSGDFL